MKKDSYIQKLSSGLGKTLGTVGGFGGSYGLIKEIIDPNQTLPDLLLSTAAIILYFLILIVIIIVFLVYEFNKYKKSKQNDDNRIKTLNKELAKSTLLLEEEKKKGKIVKFKSFWLTTEKLYFEIADKIHNKILISDLDIYNTIEETGNENQRDSSVKLSIRAIVLDNVSNIQILLAGDTNVNWCDIHFEAYEIVHDERIELESRLADEGSNTFLKQVVISFGEEKKEDSIIDLVIKWKWPNMLSVKGEDYITLPIVFSSVTKRASMLLEPKENLSFDEIGVYKYSVGTQSPVFIKNININEENKIYFKDDCPEYKSCYILYYKIANA